MNRKRLALGLAIGSVCAFLVFTLRLPAPQPVQDRSIPAIQMKGPALDITVFGTSLSLRYSWPDALGTELAECLKLPVNINRLAKAGAGSDWALEQIGAVVGAAPELVIIEFAVNDADIIDGIDLGASLSNHAAIIEIIQRDLPSAQILMLNTNPAINLPRFKRFWLSSYFGNNQELASRYELGIVDFHNRWLALPELSDLIPDGIHPSENAANSMMVPVLATHIAGALGEQCGS